MSFLEPGKYHDECMHVHATTNSKATVLIVLGGDRGDGFAVHAPRLLQLGMPKMLRVLADSIESALRDPAVIDAMIAAAGKQK